MPETLVYLLKLPNGDVSKTHYYNEDGSSLCGCGTSVLKKMLVPENGTKVTHQECVSNKNKLDKKRRKRKVYPLHKKIKRVELEKKNLVSKKYPFAIPYDVKWLARDGDGDWVGFLSKPILVEIDGSKFWTDEKNTLFYILGKHSKYRKFSKIEETLEEL